MRSPNKQLLLTGLVAGSVWAFSEVVLGAALRAMILPIRGFILTGIATAILFATFAITRRVRTVAAAVATAVLARIVFASSVGAGVSVTNGSLAVLIEGVMITAAIMFIRQKNIHRPVLLGLIASSATLLAGILFYTAGSHYDPCPYLASLSFSSFFIKEAALWAVFSGIMAPPAFHFGTRIIQQNFRFYFKPLPAWSIIIGCWISCGLTVLLT